MLPVRSAISSFSVFGCEPGLERLRADLDSGRWAERHGDLLDREAMDLGYRVVHCEIEPGPSNHSFDPIGLQGCWPGLARDISAALFT